MGLYDGVKYLGLVNSANTALTGRTGAYGAAVGTANSNSNTTSNKCMGLTQETGKSGIVCNVGSGTITSKKLGKFVIKFK